MGNVFHKASFAAAAFTSLSIIVSVGTGVLAARILGTEGRGLLAIIVFWPQFLVALVRPAFADAIIVHSKKLDSSTSVPGLYAYAFKLAWIFTLLFGPILFMLLLALHWENKTVREFSLLFAVGALVFSAQSQVFEGILRSGHRFSLINYFRISVPIFYVIILLLALPSKQGLAIFVWSHLAAMALACGFRLALVQPRGRAGTGPVGSSSPLSSQQRKSFLKTLAGFHGGSALAFVGQNIDKVLIMATLAASEVGLYVVALSLTSPVMGVMTVVLSTVALPALMNVTPETRSKIYSRLIKLTTFLAVAAAISVFVLAPVLAPLMFGEQFSESGRMAALIAIATVALPIRRCISQIFKSNSDGKNVTIMETIYIFSFVNSYFILHVIGVEQPYIYAFLISNTLSFSFSIYILKKTEKNMSIIKSMVPDKSLLSELFRFLPMKSLPSRR